MKKMNNYTYNTKNISSKRDINSRKGQKKTDGMTSRRDFRLLMILFASEAVIIIICMITAHLKVNGGASVSFRASNGFVNASKAVRSNILQKSFGGYGIEAFAGIKNAGSDGDTVSGNYNTVQYKYYTFNISDSGITTNLTKAAPGASMNGIASNTATSTVIEPSKSTLKLGNITIMNDYVHESLDLAVILNKPLIIEPMDKSSILLYHVHATEGYCETEADKSDRGSHVAEGEENNVVYIGNTMQNIIQSKSGINVLHDKTVFKEGLQSSVVYNNAALKLDEIYAQNKNIKLQIDIHRNSAEMTNGQKYGPTVTSNGIKYAQVSFVIGLDWDPVTGDRADSVNPYWEDNFRLCMLVIDKLEQSVPGIVRHIELRRNPYNQNYAENSMLVEIGFDGNLTSEADTTARLFGDVLSDIYG